MHTGQGVGEAHSGHICGGRMMVPCGVLRTSPLASAAAKAARHWAELPSRKDNDSRQTCFQCSAACPPNAARSSMATLLSSWHSCRVLPRSACGRMASGGAADVAMLARNAHRPRKPAMPGIVGGFFPIDPQLTVE